MNRVVFALFLAGRHQRCLESAWSEETHEVHFETEPDEVGDHEGRELAGFCQTFYHVVIDQENPGLWSVGGLNELVFGQYQPGAQVPSDSQNLCVIIGEWRGPGDKPPPHGEGEKHFPRENGQQSSASYAFRPFKGLMHQVSQDVEKQYQRDKGQSFELQDFLPEHMDLPGEKEQKGERGEP